MKTLYLINEVTSTNKNCLYLLKNSISDVKEEISFMISSLRGGTGEVGSVE